MGNLLRAMRRFAYRSKSMNTLGAFTSAFEREKTFEVKLRGKYNK